MKRILFILILTLLAVACCPAASPSTPPLTAPPTGHDGRLLGAAVPSYAANGQFATNGFRLSLTTATPVTTTDVTAATILYLTPYTSGQIAAYTSSSWAVYSSAEVSLTPTLAASKVYDVFVYYSAGLTLVLSAAWTNDTTRADALATQNGVTVLSSDHSRRWVGTIRSNASSQMNDSLTLRTVWNAYNQVPRKLKVTDSTDSWAYTTAAYRISNGAAGNAFTYVSGNATSYVRAYAYGISSSNLGSQLATGIGIDSETVNSADFFGITGNTLSGEITPVQYGGYPGLGAHTLSWLEFGGAGGTFYGDVGAPTSFQAGMSGEIQG